MQHIIVEFLINENMKPLKILTRPRAQFSDKTFSRTQMYDWS